MTRGIEVIPAAPGSARKRHKDGSALLCNERLSLGYARRGVEAIVDRDPFVQNAPGLRPRPSVESVSQHSSMSARTIAEELLEEG